MAFIKLEAQEFEGLTYVPGDYIGIIESITPNKTRSGKRKYDIKLTGEGFGQITHPLYDSVYGRGELFNIYKALGIDPTRSDVDETEVIDNYIGFTIVEEEYNEKPTYRVTNFRPAGDTDAGEVTDEDDDW